MRRSAAVVDLWSSGQCLAYVGFRAPRQLELQQHHQPELLPLSLRCPLNSRLHSPESSTHLSKCFTILKMAALFSGAPPQGGPGYSFKQTPTAAPSGERQHGFYPYDSPVIVQYTHADTSPATPTMAAQHSVSPVLTSPSSLVTHDRLPATTSTHDTHRSCSRLVARDQTTRVPG
jgi:hypothetical protein